MITYVIWCDLCGQRRVERHGDICVGCAGTIDAAMTPDTRQPLEPRSPSIPKQILTWLLTGKRWAA